MFSREDPARACGKEPVLHFRSPSAALAHCDRVLSRGAFPRNGPESYVTDVTAAPRASLKFIEPPPKCCNILQEV